MSLEKSLAYLDLHRVTKRYRGVTAVEDLSLSVIEGEMLCLLGPSGCGKTTTLRIIAGFEDIDAGSVHLDKRDVTLLAPEKRDIGLVFQNYALFPHMTVHENIAFGLEMRRHTRSSVDAAVKEALDLVRLADIGSRYPRQLSGGQQQRVAIARAIAIRPRLLLLDEPLSNLDAKLRDAMRDEIRRIQREVGITAIFVTHDQLEALAMADRMAVMDKGRIVQIDTPTQVYERPAHPFIAGFIGQANLLQGHVVSMSENVVAVDVQGCRLSGLSDVPLALGQPAIAVIKTDKMRLSRTLPDAAIAVLKGKIESRTYLGPSRAFACTTAQGPITVVMPSSESAEFKVGDDVFATWSQQECLVIPGLS